MSATPRILFCQCAQAHVFPEENHAATLKALRDSALPFEVVADLCGLSAQCHPGLKEFAASTASDGGVVIACHARTVRWLIAAAGADWDEKNIRVINLRRETPASIPDAIAAIPVMNERGGDQESAPLFSAGEGDWIPWAPVIDFQRCTNCMQCLGFCLFGVYSVDEKGSVQVTDPEHCKTSCPACARVCPESAIIFPKHHSDAINGGSNEVSREPMRVDLSALLGGDLYGRLRQRNQTRFSTERDPQQALEERRRHLADFVQAGEIPPEVLSQLPAAEELARLAEQAKAKALHAAAKKEESEC